MARPASILVPEERAGDRPGRGRELFRPATCHDLAAVRPRAGAQVNDPVGGANHGLVVLDDDHAVTLALKPRGALQ